MDAVASTLEREFPNDNQNVGVMLTSLRDDLVSDVRPTILLLFAAVGLLLVIATANVSGLLIARATARQPEMAVRIALGAGRGRILAQLLTESIVLSILGGAAGVLLAMWLIGPLISLSPADLGVAGAITVDRRVLLFGLALSTIAGLYGVLAFLVAQRQREIGVRMALGARPRDVVANVLGQGLRLAGVGIVIGIGLALAATRLPNALLFGTNPTDVLTYAAVATLLVAIAVGASVVPALSASRVDPLIALRDE